MVAQAEADASIVFAAQEQLRRLRRFGRMAARVFNQVAQQQAQSRAVGLHGADTFIQLQGERQALGLGHLARQGSQVHAVDLQCAMAFCRQQPGR